MSEITERLRAITWPDRVDSDVAETCTLAAAEIERLRAEVEYWKRFVPLQVLRDFPFKRNCATASY